MKFRTQLPALLSTLLCLGLLTSAAPAANPLKAIGSRIKKVGSALTPWKKKEAAESPAPVAKPAAAAKPATKPKPAATSKPPAPKAASKKTTAPRPSTKTKKPAGDSESGSTTAKRKGANGEVAAVAGSDSKSKSKNNNEADNASETNGDKPADAANATTTNTDGAAGNAPGDTPESKPAAAAPIPLADIPFGTPVMGKRGHVRSPYAEDQGMVDVTGIAAGTKVKCPFSGKIFRVP